MVGYCMKDNGQDHFEFVHYNVFAEDRSEGKMKYTKFGKVGLKKCVSLSHNNILQCAHQWARSRMKKHLGVSPLGTLFHMCKSGLFYPNPTWVIPLQSAGMDVRRASSIWKIIKCPYNIKMEDISNGFFNTIKGMSNLRYFNVQHVALDHRMEKRDLNMALHDNDKVTMEGDAIDEATYFNMNIHCTILRT